MSFCNAEAFGERFGGVSEAAEVHDCKHGGGCGAQDAGLGASAALTGVRPVPLHRDELKVAPKVLRVPAQSSVRCAIPCR